MGTYFSLESQIKCKKIECTFSLVVYQSVIMFPYIIPYENITEIIKAHVLKDYFVTSYHYNSYTYIVFQACDKCCKDNDKKYMKYEKTGYNKYKFNN